MKIYLKSGYCEPTELVTTTSIVQMHTSIGGANDNGGFMDLPIIEIVDINKIEECKEEINSRDAA